MWMRRGEGTHDVLYRPTGKEVLQYLHAMADHGLVDIRTSTAYCRHEQRAQSFSVFTSNGMITTRGLVFAPGAHETTAGSPNWPIEPMCITNGSHTVHSSSLNDTFYSAKKKYVVGASKAAIDVIETFDPADESVVWAHRGHILFHNRDFVHAYMTMKQPISPDAIAQAHSGNLFLKEQQFAIAFDGLLKRGHGVCVGQPLTAHPALRDS